MGSDWQLVLGTKYFVVALAVSAGGCSKSNQAFAVEPSFEQQLSAVKSGQSDTIEISSSRVSDDDVGRIVGTKSLRVLLVDQPDSRITAAGLKQLAESPRLEHLRLRGPGVDNDALAEIAKIPSLRILNLPQGEFSDEGLQHLKALPQLVQLRFHSARVTDAGMSLLAEFPSLARLHLIDVPITDAGLKTLAGMRGLESLYIDGGEFSNTAVDQLFQARPDLHVHLNQQHHDRDPNKHP